MSDGRAYYPRAYVRPAPSRPDRESSIESRRSNAAIPVAVGVVLLGLYLGQYSLLAPGSLGFLLVFSGLSFLSTRINPLSPHFYLTRKPSWLATGVVFLGGLILVYDAYVLFVHQFGSVTLPRL